MKRFKFSIYLLTASAGCLLQAIADQAVSTKITPAFQAELSFSYGHRAGAAESVILGNLTSGTNRSILPGGMHEWFFVFEGQRGGKDVYTVGARFPVGATNEVSVAKEIEYGGERVKVWLSQEDSVVIEPRKGPNLSADEAAQLAAKLANEECERRYRRRPFTAAQHAVVLQEGKYRWGGLDVGGPGGFSALVTFRQDGSKPHVEVYFSTDIRSRPERVPNYPPQR
jgi:hypothetical protein